MNICIVIETYIPKSRSRQPSLDGACLGRQLDGKAVKDKRRASACEPGAFLASPQYLRGSKRLRRARRPRTGLNDVRSSVNTYCLLSTVYSLLPTASCLQPLAYSLLPTASCLLSTAYCRPPASIDNFSLSCILYIRLNHSPKLTPPARNHDSYRQTNSAESSDGRD